jgi:hypothetical protein
MEFLASFFVGKPLNSVAVAAVYIGAYFARRFTAVGSRRCSPWPLVAAIAWTIYSAWEWLILVLTPDANIRVDLLVIWPALAVLSAWALFRLLR